MKILILGNSNIFQRKIYFALKKFKKLNIEIASTQKINNKFKISKQYKDYDEAINNTKAKVVYISLINSIHYKWALKALKKDKHVIIDKPITVNYNQTVKLINLASKKKLLLSEAIVFQNDARFKKIIEKIDLQKDTKISCAFHIPKLEKNNFRNFRKYGGGCFQDMSPYASYLIYSFFKNKKYLIKTIKKFDMKKSEVGFDLTVKSKNIFLEASFSFNNLYKNEMYIQNKTLTYFVNYPFSPPINKILNLEIFNQKTKRKQTITFNKQNVFYTYFYQLFKILRKNKYNYFYREIQDIAKIKKKIS